MRYPLLLSLLLLLTLPTGAAPAQAPDLQQGAWHAWLDAPGGELPFGLDFALGEDGTLEATVVNGPERIPIPKAEWNGARLTLDFEHYASRIVAKRMPDGTLKGDWTKRLAGGKWANLPFHATPGTARRFTHIDAEVRDDNVTGRWHVDFENDELAAVGIFTQKGRVVSGTFLTATGDYRYLAGEMSGKFLRLSVFDGAHAFLFHATMDEDDVLSGDFWSRDTYHETWRAWRDNKATLPDAFEQTTWDTQASLADFVVPDLEGDLRSLAEPEFAGKAILLQLFGSWCPNCHDEGAYLAEIYRRYKDRGLMVLGLAFELNDDHAKDAEQVRRYAKRHGCEYPFFVVGSAASKKAASKAFPAIDRLRSYPTTVFMNGRGQVRAVHSGFSGPATGKDHVELTQEFERLIEELLTEESAPEEAWELLSKGAWIDQADLMAGGSKGTSFNKTADDSGTFGEAPVTVRGDAIRIGETVWRLDAQAQALLHPTDIARRMSPADAPAWPLLAELEIDEGTLPAVIVTHLDPVVRREALLAAGWAVNNKSLEASAVQEAFAQALEDDDPRVRATAAYATTLAPASRFKALLEANLQHPNVQVRRESVRALGKRGDQAKMWAMRFDPDPIVREYVTKIFQ